MQTESQLRTIAIDQAGEWYMRHRGGDLTPAEHEDFLGWLSASPVNTHEYLAVARVWGGMKEAVMDMGWDPAPMFEHVRQGQEGAVAVLGRERMREPHPRWRLVLLAASLAVAAVAAYQLAPVSLTGRAVVITGGNHPGTVHLDDGSVVWLNVNARVKVRFSDAQRLIELDRGQAFFDVARDARRPFRVQAGDSEAVAIGTQFDVARADARGVTVTVAQGRVEVLPDTQARTSMDAFTLDAGEQLRIGDPSQVLAPRPVDVRAVTGWMRKEVIFDDQPLAEVAQVFNQYLSTPIRIEDPALRAIEVNGVFNTYDPDSFLIFLRQYDVAIERGRRAIIVRRNDR